MKRGCVKIGDCVDRVSKWKPKKEAPNELVKYIDTGAVCKDKKAIVKEEVQEVLGKDAPSRARQLVKEGDVLVSTIRPNLNGVAQVSQEWHGATASTGFSVLRPNERIDGDYLFRWLMSPFFVDTMISQATGASYPAVSNKIVCNSEIPLPPLKEQKRIAEILDEADRVRKKTQALIDKYDELAQSLFLDMFGDPVTNPKGWEVVQLGEKLVAKGGKRLPKGADYSVSPTEWPYLRVADMRVNAVELSELKFLTEEVQSQISRYTISKDDVFISIAGTIGVAGWIPDELDGCNLTENAAKIVGLREARLRKEFLSFFLNSHFVQREIEARTMAVGVPKLALFRIESLPLMLPPLELQEEFLDRLGKIQACKIRLEQNDEGGKNLFNALLQKAFKGELT